jgi:hypothetical protein
MILFTNTSVPLHSEYRTTDKNTSEEFGLEGLIILGSSGFRAYRQANVA